jgi:hypothetical protein
VSEAAAGQHRQVETAPIVGDQVRLSLLGEAGEVAEGFGLCLALADHADAQHGIVRIEPEHADGHDLMVRWGRQPFNDTGF